MKSSLFLLLFIYTVTAGSLNAQNWHDMMKDRQHYTLEYIEKAYEDQQKAAEFKKEKEERSQREAHEKYRTMPNKFGEDEGDESNAIFNRFKWFWEKRVDENGNFPDEGRAFREWKTFEQSTYQRFGKSAGNGAAFTSQGPFETPGGYAGIGHIDQIAFHPTNKNIFYAVSNGSHLWKTTDGGQSYTSLTDRLPAMHIYKVEVDITNPDRILFTQNQVTALYQSLDAGATWTTINSPMRINENLIQNPETPGQWFATAGNTLYRSNDNALTWSAIGANTSVDDGNAYLQNLTLKPGSNGKIMYATGGYDPIKFYRSANGGLNWSLVATWADTRYARIAVCPASPNLVIVCAARYESLEGIYKSTDEGKTFNKVLNGTYASNLFSYASNGFGFDGQAWWGFDYEINPLNPNQHFCGSINNWRSNDGGETWHLITAWTLNAAGAQITHADKHFLKFNPNDPTSLYECNDGGIYRSTDYGTNWQSISNTLVTSQIYKVTPPPANAVNRYSLIGTQDNGSKRRNNDGSWVDELGGDGMDNEIDPLNSNTCYLSLQYGEFYRSDDGGNTLTYISGMLQHGSGSTAFVTPVAIDTSFLASTSRPARVFIANKNRIAKSIDKGLTWSFIPHSLGPNLPVTLNVSDSQTLIVGHYDNILRTTNGGASWLNINPETSYLYRFIYVVTDPHNSDRIWVVSGSPASNKIWHSANAGTSWTNITYNLPYGTYNSLAIDFDSPTEDLYISSDNGIATKTKTGTAWSVYGTGLPYVGINEIQIDRSSNTLVVATYGRGLWSVPLAGGAGITFSGKVFLQAAYDRASGLMNTTLNTSGILQSKALQQPFNNTNFNYAGVEKVAGNIFSLNPAIVDWILVELRDASSPSSILAKRAAFVKSDGTLVDTDGTTPAITFPGISAGNYYVSLKHRNHLGIRSSVPLNFGSGTAYYDFTTSAGQSFQNQDYTSTVQLNGVWAMRAGNANSNDNTKYNGPDNDQDRIQNVKLGGLLSQVLTNQYAPEDINMDGTVKANGPDNDQNYLLNMLLNGLLSTIFLEQL